MVCLGDLPGVAAQTFPYLVHCCRILQPADAALFALPVSDGHLSCINTEVGHIRGLSYTYFSAQASKHSLEYLRVEFLGLKCTLPNYPPKRLYHSEHWQHCREVTISLHLHQHRVLLVTSDF